MHETLTRLQWSVTRECEKWRAKRCPRAPFAKTRSIAVRATVARGNANFKALQIHIWRTSGNRVDLFESGARRTKKDRTDGDRFCCCGARWSHHVERRVETILPN